MNHCKELEVCDSEKCPSGELQKIATPSSIKSLNHCQLSGHKKLMQEETFLYKSTPGVPPYNRTSLAKLNSVLSLVLDDHKAVRGGVVGSC